MPYPSDIINPAGFSAYMEATFRSKAVFTASGAARVDFDDPALSGAGGQLVTLRQFAEDTADDEKNDGQASSAASIGSIKNVGILCARKRWRQVDDAAKAALDSGSQDAIIQTIGNQIVPYWARKSEKSLISILSALFASTGCLYATHAHVVGSAAGTKKYLNYNAIVDGMAKLGDDMESLALFITPSKTWADLKKENASKIGVAYITNEFGVPVAVPVFDGNKLVFVSDQFPADTGGTNALYHTFLVRLGAMVIAPTRGMKAYPYFKGDVPMEGIMSTFDFVPHVYGTMWNTSYPSGGPANSDLATAASWSVATGATAKDIGVIDVITN